jgi:hypothetical protein
VLTIVVVPKANVVGVAVNTGVGTGAPVPVSDTVLVVAPVLAIEMLPGAAVVVVGVNLTDTVCAVASCVVV